MYKDIIVKNEDVIIKHFVLDEYKSHDFCKEYTPLDYARDVENCYRLCERLNLCKVLETRPEFILTIMPKYDPVDPTISIFGNG